MDEKVKIKAVLKNAKEYEEIGSFAFGFFVVTVISGLVIFQIPQFRGYLSNENNKSPQTTEVPSETKKVAELTELPETPELYVKEGKLYSPFVPARYTVKPGDSTWVIAQKIYATGENYRDIEQANQLSLNASLNAGQVLNLPDVPSQLSIEEYSVLFPISPTPIPTQVNSTGGKIHVVSRTEGLWQVAEAYYGDGNQYLKIFDANKDKMRTPEDIREGMELRIP